MRTVRIKDIFDSIVRGRGLDPDTASLSAGEKARIAEHLNDRVEMVYAEEWWPELMLIEEREYRETWASDEQYSESDEVYLAGHYYRSLQNSNLNKAPATETEWWESADDDLMCTVAFAQDGETEIWAVDTRDCVYERDPRLYPGTEPLSSVRILEDAILVAAENAPAQPWIRFKPVPPRFSWTEWSAASTFATADIIYKASTGESYVALQPSQNKDPESELEYWSVVQAPAFLRRYLIHAVRADEMLEDEGRYKEEGKASAELDRIRETQVDAVAGRKVVFRK